MTQKISKSRATARVIQPGHRRIALPAAPSPSPAAGTRQIGTANQRLVLDLIRRSKGLSRADLTRATGLTPQASSDIVARLVSAGYIKELARRTGGRGYPSRIYALKPDGAFAFGVSIDADRLSIVLANLAGMIVARDSIPLPGATPDDVFATLRTASVAQLDRAKIGWGAVIGMGLGIAGRYDPDHATLIPPESSPEWANIPVAERLQQQFGVPIFWDNDASAAAIGECFRGAGMPFQNLLYLHIGRGIGSGLILSGEPYRGAQGNAGEIGRIPVQMPHLSATPLRLSKVASLRALAGRLAHDITTGDALSQRFAAGEAEIHAWLADAANALGQALTSVVYMLDVEAIIVGGDLPDTMAEALTGMMVTDMARSLYRWNRPPQIIRGEVGPEASAVGAATLPLFSVFSPTG